jgi:hypothetical protein
MCCIDRLKPQPTAEVSPSQMFSNDGSGTVESLYEMGTTATWQSKMVGILLGNHQSEKRMSLALQIKVIYVSFQQVFSF